MGARRQLLVATSAGAVLACLLVAGPASADEPVVTPFEADAYLNGPVLWYDEAQSVSDDLDATTGPLAASLGAYSASAEARARRSAGSLIQIRGASSAPEATSELNDYFSTAAAGGAWHDVLFARGEGDAPDTVRMTFAVDGTIAVTLVPESGILFRPNLTTAGVAVLARGLLIQPPLDFAFLVGGGSSHARAIVEHVQLTEVSAEALDGGSTAWSSAVFTTDDDLTYDFAGEVELLTPFFSAGELGLADGGYLASVSASAGSSVRGGDASAEFFGTVKLADVSLPDGSPLPEDMTFFFGSGLTTHQVPEPAALFQSAVVLVALGGLRLRRRAIA